MTVTPKTGWRRGLDNRQAMRLSDSLNISPRARWVVCPPGPHPRARGEIPAVTDCDTSVSTGKSTKDTRARDNLKADTRDLRAHVCTHRPASGRSKDACAVTSDLGPLQRRIDEFRLAEDVEWIDSRGYDVTRDDPAEFDSKRTYQNYCCPGKRTQGFCVL